MAKPLKVNDKVMVISGDNKGKTATIVKIDKQARKACLEGIEVRERHLKKSYLNPAGGKKTVHLGLDLSNLKLVESSKFTKKSTKSVKSSVKKLDKSADKQKSKKGGK